MALNLSELNTEMARQAKLMTLICKNAIKRCSEKLITYDIGNIIHETLKMLGKKALYHLIFKSGSIFICT